MTEVVEDGGIDDLLNRNVFNVLLAVESKVDRDDLCSDGGRDIHPGLFQSRIRLPIHSLNIARSITA